MFTINSLHLENFMIVENADFTFNENQMTAITGQNGTGKSTLLYAIAFCITGYRKGETFKNYIKAGTEEARLTLDATFNGYPIHYDIVINNIVHRTVTYKDVVYTNSEYSQFLKENKLEELCELMFMFQGTSSIIDAGARERSDKLKKLFKMEFPDIVNNLKEEQENVKTTNAQLQAVSTELQSIKSETLPMMREMTDEYINQCKDNLSEINSKLSQTKNVDVSELDSIESQLVSCQKQITKAEDTITQDEKSLKSFESKLKISNDYLNNTDISNLNKELEEEQNKLDNHKIQYENDSKIYKELTEEHHILSYREKELKNQYEISKTGICHACGQPIEESHIKKLKDELEDISFKLKENNDKIKDLNFDSKDNVGKNLSNNITLCKENINKYNTEIKNRDSYQSRIDDITSIIRDRKDLIKNLNDKKTTLLDSKETLLQLLPLIEERNNLIREKDNLEGVLKKAEETHIKNIERRTSNERILKEKTERENKIKSMTDKINELSVKSSRLKTEIDIFNVKFPNYITLQACNKLEDYINSIVQKVFPYCKVSLKLENTGLGVFYTTESSEDDYIPISMASGCQRQILAIAYFVALARMSGVSSIFLDEIDASSSSENARVIYEFIAGLDCFNQIFFISHRPESYQVVKESNEELVTYIVENGNYTEI